MIRFAVAFYNQFDNVLKVEVIVADTWQKAATLHSQSPWLGRDLTPETTIEEARMAAFDLESGFDIVEIT